jgi:hypothetical protein
MQLDAEKILLRVVALSLLALVLAILAGHVPS